MIKILLSCALLVSLAADAQQPPVDSATISERTKVGTFLHRWSVGLPDLFAVGFAPSSTTNAFDALSNGADKLYSSTAGGLNGAFFGFSVNTTSRILSFTWKNRFGFDIDRAGYSIDVNFLAYRNKLQALKPNYYINGINPYELSSGTGGKNGTLNCYSGWVFGTHYNFPLGKYVLQPAVFVGFKNGDGVLSFHELTAEYNYKEAGSNYVMHSTVKSEVIGGTAYIAQLIICRYFTDTSFFKSHIKYDIGVKANLAVMPYDLRTTITDKPWGQPETIYTAQTSAVRKALGIVAYFSLMLN